MDLKSFGYRLIFSFLIFVAWINLNLGFNLETRLPVIKRGTPNTYFGYSVAEHQSVNEITSEITHSWLLVGAPLGKNLQPGTNRSGALFRCPITEVNEYDCEQVITDGKRDPRFRNYPKVFDSKKKLDSDFLSEPALDELKEGQWLGVTVRSQGPGKKVLVCAHRYISRGDTYHWGWGLCYTLTQMLDYDSAWEFCRGRPTDNAHEQYGFCQIGTSGALLDGDMAVIGSPGPYTWRGTAFVVNISDNYLERDKTIYQVPVDSSTSPVPKYSYLGMSVTGGKFLNANYTTYVAGAPRAHETGEVVLFSKPTSNSNLMNVDVVLKGEQFSSSFGYEVATADVNGDGLPDLLVGAPFYFDKNEGGAVYIYLNKNHCLTCSDVGKITGKLESRFGFAIANLGDINKDGFDDIAVGAPYEGNGKVYIYLGSAKGLIPTASQVICPESSKPLNGIKTFGYSLSGGMDLDRNEYPDLLIGAYESDTVVLLRARPIIELDSSIGPKRALREIDPSRHGCEKDPDSKNTCFSFQSCVTVLTVDKENRGLKLEDGDGLTLHYKLESDYKRKISRVWIGHDSTERPVSIQNNITLQRNAKNELTHCQEHIVYIKETAKDIQSPIDFKLEYALIQKEPVMPKVGDRFQSVDQYPILNKQEAEKIFQATFLKDCGPDDRCDSQLSIQASLDLPYYDKKYNISKLLIGQDDEITVNIEVFNVNEPAYEAQLFFIHPETLSYKKFYDTSPKKSEGKPISCESHNSTMVICNLGNPFKKLKPAKLHLKFDLKGSDDLLPMLEFTAFANSTSNEIEPLGPTTLRARVIKQAELSIRGLARPETVFFGGEVKGESAIQYTDEIGSRIQHIYQVVNKGPWKVHDLKVNIEWPFEVANNKPHGKWLLYIDEQPTIAATNGGECFLPPEQVNERNFIIRSGVDTPLGATTQPSVPFTYNSSNVDSSTPHRRTRRDMEMMVRPETTYDAAGKPHKKFRMNCTLGTAKCLKFHCKVKLLEKNQEATIIIKARLWNSTLVEDYLDSEVVEISSKASLSIPYLSVDNIEQQDTKDDQFEVVTEAKVETLQLKTEEVDWWVYILAIVLGLLLLTLLTVLLWKLGFFKRKRMEDPTLSGNLEKHRDY